MSWYDKDIVTCPVCRSRHSTPIDCFEHRRNCKVPNADGFVIAKVGDYGREPIKVTRGVVEEGRTIWFKRADGTKARGKVKSIVRDTAVFIELPEKI